MLLHKKVEKPFVRIISTSSCSVPVLFIVYTCVRFIHHLIQCISSLCICRYGALLSFISHLLPAIIFFIILNKPPLHLTVLVPACGSIQPQGTPDTFPNKHNRHGHEWKEIVQEKRKNQRKHKGNNQEVFCPSWLTNGKMYQPTKLKGDVFLFSLLIKWLKMQFVFDYTSKCDKMDVLLPHIFKKIN